MRRLIYLPLAVLIAAYLLLCLHHGTLCPWNIVVHEDGKHTLLGTLFYFEHAIGELPLDILLAAAVAGAAGTAVSGSRVRLLLACLALDAVICVAASLEVGARKALLYFTQFHTRDDVPLIYGSHWHYHFLSQIALMLLPLIVIALPP